MRKYLSLSVLLFIACIGSMCAQSITMTTERKIGEKIYLAIDADGEISATGLKEPLRNGTGDYTLSSQTVELKGAIGYLNCYDNDLTSLDVTKTTTLENLSCYRNKLTVLDVSTNPKLGQLHCNQNLLTALDLTKNTAVIMLNCFGNKIKGKAMTALVNSLPAIPADKPTAWVNILDSKNEAEGNVCTKPDVAVAKGKRWDVSDRFGGRPVPYEGSEPKEEPVTGNVINITVSKEALGQPFYMFINALGEVTITGASAPSGEQETYTLTSETLTIAGDVTSLDCSQNKNKIVSIDISSCNTLEKLWCQDNDLTTLKLKSPSLKFLMCKGCNLTNLDISECPEMRILYAHENAMTKLDVKSNPKLAELLCYTNKLSTIDLSNSGMLREFYCYGNQFTAFDLSACIKLKELYCFDNKLKSLDFSKNPKLVDLDCYDNEIAGEAMTQMIQSLPVWTPEYKAKLLVINTKSQKEKNTCTKADVELAKSKGWTLYDNNGGNEIVYTPTASAKPLSEAFRLYPTNVTDNLRLTLPASFIGKKASVFDQSGCLVLITKVTGTSMSLFVGNLTAGTYLLSIDGQVQRFVVE